MSINEHTWPFYALAPFVFILLAGFIIKAYREYRHGVEQDAKDAAAARATLQRIR